MIKKPPSPWKQSQWLVDPSPRQQNYNYGWLPFLLWQVHFLICGQYCCPIEQTIQFGVLTEPSHIARKVVPTFDKEKPSVITPRDSFLKTQSQKNDKPKTFECVTLFEHCLKFRE